MQSTSIAPKFWIAFSRLTITFFRDMAMAPFERQTETIIGSISGVSPTATARAKKNASLQSCFVKPLIEEHERRHDRHQRDHQPGELVDAPVEAGRRLPGR